MDKSPFNKNSAKGFSFMEMVIYVTILVFIVVVLISTMLVISKTYKKVSVGRTIETSAVLALDRTTREIKNSNSIDATGSVFDSNPGSITLSGLTATGSPRTVKIYAENNILKIMENGTYRGQLTASNTSVTNFVLKKIDHDSSDAVKIEMTIQSGTGEYQKSENFYATAILKGSY